MKIRNTSFSIDTASIGGTSIDKHEIRLPYTGELPTSYESAYLRVYVEPGSTQLVIVATHDGRKTYYGVDATSEEIISLLDPFFFKPTKQERHFITRFDNGLSNYWTGYFQQGFLLWEQYTRQPLRIAEIVQQLTPAQRVKLYRCLLRTEIESGEMWAD